jgi:RimJ/RimL family protein N-acetyltransferase
MQRTTSRLILREFQLDDWQAVLRYQSDPLYLRYYAWESRTEEDVRAFVSAFVAQQAESPRCKFQFALTLREDNRLIGNCGLRITTSPPHGQANIGYELDSSFWGNGYATEAASDMLEFGFTALGMQCLSADCLSENMGSLRVLEKIGMREKALLRDSEHFKGRNWDSVHHTLTRDEWQKAAAKRSPCD